MPLGNRLRTYVQISDLHFGDIDPTTFESVAPTYWSNSQCFDGALGHHYVALQRLMSFFRKMQKQEQAELLVTGDLTSMGKVDQFDTANDFLSARLSPSKGRIGLGVVNWRDKAISGNHDYFAGAVNWHGGPMLGGPTPGLAKYFPSLPFVTRRLPLPPTSAFLRFVGIDTDADNWAYGINRFLARGSFVKQLVHAEAMLGPPRKDEIRVLLMHHSRAHQTGYKLRIDRKSRSALDRFLIQMDVPVLLSGHKHEPIIDLFNLTSNSPPRVMHAMEGRCGSTTQRDVVPLHWFNILGIAPSRTWPPNTLLVHRLLEERGTIYWDIETYTRTTYRFKRRGPTGRLEVWPRPP
jgi:calcineurin-like phosphoesterase family protein